MKNKITSLLPLILFTVVVFLGGGKLLYQFNIVSILILVAFMYLTVINKIRIIRIEKLYLPLAGFLIWVLVTTITSKNAYVSALSLNRIILYVIFFVLAANLLEKKETVLWLSAVGILQNCLIFYQKLNGITPYGLFPNNPNLVTGFIASLAALSLIYYLDNRKGITSVSRTVLIACFLLGCVNIFMGTSRSVMAILLVFIAYQAWVIMRIKGMVIFSVVALLLGIALSQNFARKGDPWAFYRVEIWNSAIDMIKENPVYGCGLGNFGRLFPKYNFPVKESIAKYGKETDFAHNEFLQIASEMGIPGLVFIIWLTVSAFGAVKKTPYLLFPFVILLWQAIFDMNLHLPANIFLLLIILALAYKNEISVEEPAPDIRNAVIPFASVFIVINAFLLAGENKFNPLNSKYYFEAARTKNDQDKITWLEKAVRFDPHNYQYRLSLAYYYRKFAYGNQYLMQKTIKELNETLMLNPYSPFANYYLGGICYDLKEYGRAKEYFSAALDIEPNYLWPRYFLIKCCLMLKEKEKAQDEKKRLEEIWASVKGTKEISGYIHQLIDFDQKKLSELEIR